MMMLAAVAVSVTLPAVAQTGAPSVAEPKKEKKSCRRYTVTGSIVGTRAVCHTVSEWAAIDGANSRNAQDTLDDSRLRNSNPLAK
ncbi:hypothetical protein FPZ24_16595 [Sphingomonas panacisoli]|uniref:Uncharacterized protein n=1 Tax=Sphingomonas panacisoli TaxID=1813879 RepID=A0A5B8LLD8_9SPHN|nr:hypothetical protein [Sphingomonas panacisoli]QDZ08893.1 hypothetical protein FPZ24_16595 [Sphingomonas panacisoli]